MTDDDTSATDDGYDVALRTVDEDPTAVVAATTTWPEFPALWGQLLDEVYAVVRAGGGGGVEKAGHNVMLYKDDRPDVEVGVQVAGPFAAVGRVVPSVLPAGRVVATVHRGPYDRLGAAHDAVHRWAVANGHVLTRVRWEIYGDWAEDPAELETAVCWLVAE
jgi:effector-binding domain-containing protein